MEIKNDSGRNLVISLGAQAPKNFETSFTEQYGSQELSSIPIDAGQSKTVKLKVRPPSTTGANRYPVTVKASAEDASAETSVALEITGQPQLSIAGRDGVLSGKRRGRQADDDPDRRHQQRHRAGRRDRAFEQRAKRLEDRIRAEDAGCDCAGTEQGSPGAGRRRRRRRLPATTLRPSPPRRVAKPLRPSSALRFRPRRCGAPPASASSASRC